MNKKFDKTHLILFIMFPLGVLIDQLTKILAIKYLSDGTIITLIPNFFSLLYVENTGAAWGMMKNRVLLSIISAVATIGIIVYYFVGKHKKITKVALAMMATGAFGNFIDRAFFGRVIDMLDINLFVFFGGEFPVCNVADLFVSYGAILFAIAIIFFDKD